MKMGDKTKYPIFIKCSSYTLDEYWKDIFYNCSLGRFPRGISYLHAQSQIKVTDSKKKIEYFQIKDDPIEMFKIMMTIFKDKLKMISKKDQERQKNDFENINVEVKVFESWDKIKCKILKEQFIDDYCVNIQNKLSLTLKETQYLRSLINYGLLFKYLEIVFCNGKIKSIKNLKYNNSSNKFYIFNIDEKLKKIIRIKKVVEKPSDNPLVKCIDKYIKNF